MTSGEGNNDGTLDDGEITRAELEEMTMGNMRRYRGAAHDWGVAGEIAASTNAKVASVALNDPIPTATCEQNREPNGQQSLKHDHKSIDVRIVTPHENVSGVLDESRTARGMPVVVPRVDIVPRESTGAQVLWKLIIFLETNYFWRF